MAEKAEQPEPADDSSSPRQGISLTALTEAFAQAMGWRKTAAPVDPAGSAGTAAAPSGEESSGEPADEAGEPADEGEDPCQISPTSILEAMLFVGNYDNEPLTAERAAELMRGVEAGEIPGLVDQLNARYAASGCPYTIASEGAGYRLVLRRAFHPLRSRFYGRAREAKLSQAAVDVLAIVAYRQPLTADEVTALRGIPSAHILSQLVRRQLLQIERVAGEPRKTLFRTTERFLSLFGLDSLGDLPQSEDLEK